MVPFTIEIVVLKQLKLLYTRVGTLLHGSLHNSDCGAATIEVVTYKSMLCFASKHLPPQKCTARLGRRSRWQESMWNSALT